MTFGILISYIRDVKKIFEKANGFDFLMWLVRVWRARMYTHARDARMGGHGGKQGRARDSKAWAENNGNIKRDYIAFYV